MFWIVHEENKLPMQMWLKEKLGSFSTFPVQEQSVEVIVKQFKIIQSNFKSSKRETVDWFEIPN